MRFLADENCDAALIVALRADGHDVQAIAEYLPGADDDTVIAEAIEQARTLITEDKDFGAIAFSCGGIVQPVILIRVPPGDRHAKIARIRHLLANHGDRLPGHFTVVESHAFRFRRL